MHALMSSFQIFCPIPQQAGSCLHSNKDIVSITCIPELHMQCWQSRVHMLNCVSSGGHCPGRTSAQCMQSLQCADLYRFTYTSQVQGLAAYSFHALRWLLKQWWAVTILYSSKWTSPLQDLLIGHSLLCFAILQLHFCIRVCVYATLFSPSWT